MLQKGTMYCFNLIVKRCHKRIYVSSLPQTLVFVHTHTWYWT